MSAGIVIVGDSTHSNSLGRAISMYMTARELGPAQMWVIDDGPVWSGAQQFDVPFRTVKAVAWRRLASEIARQYRDHESVVWFSKGTWPLNRIARQIRQQSTALLIADFDDDDVTILSDLRSSGLTSRLKLPATRRKHPWRISQAQRDIASVAHAVSYSSEALGSHLQYHQTSARDLPSAAIPHTRMPPRAEHLAAISRDGAALRIGFLGTIRAHKGADRLVALLRHAPSAEVISFKQAWTPPTDLAGRWTQAPPSTPLGLLYGSIDVLVLPMSMDTTASTLQLPAKLVDAAAHARAVLATPTPPIVEYAKDAIIATTDWADPEKVFRLIEANNLAERGQALRQVYERSFSVAATGRSLQALIDRVRISDARRSVD